jgi:hypothetical protein
VRQRAAIAVLVALVALGTAAVGIAAGAWQPGATDPLRKLSAVEVTPEPIGPPAALLAEPLPSPPGTTERVSVANNENQANSGSGGVTNLIDAANGDQAISGDGRWVAFVSTATNLVPGGSQPGGLFLRDRQDGTTTAIPWINGVPFPEGVVAAEPAINRDGSVVAFTVIIETTLRGVAVVAGEATPYVLAWDRATGTELVSMDDLGQPSPGYQPSISADGRYVAYTRWAPQATPPPNTAPSIANLRASPACIDAASPASTVTVTATDPDGDPLNVRIQLSWNSAVRPPVLMTPAGGNSWTYQVTTGDLNAFGWTSGQIHYAVTAQDSRGADSNTLTDNPFLDPPTNSIIYQPSGCTIL